MSPARSEAHDEDRHRDQHEREDQPRFDPRLVIDARAIVTDVYGNAWLVDPEVGVIRKALAE
jgi:hypothetical protein